MSTPAAASSSRVNSGVWPNSVKLARIGTLTALELLILGEIGDGFGEDHVGARRNASLHALDGPFQPLTRERIGTRHDHELSSSRASTAALMRSTISALGTISLPGR